MGLNLRSDAELVPATVSDVVEVEDGDGPATKKAKIGKARNVADIEIRRAAFVSKAFAVATSIVSCLTYDQTVYGLFDKSHINVEYVASDDKFSLSVKCLFCSAIVKCKSTGYEAADLSNFKRHSTVSHIEKETRKQKGQRTLKEMLPGAHQQNEVDDSSNDQQDQDHDPSGSQSAQNKSS